LPPSSGSNYSSIPKIEAIYSYKTSAVFQKITWCHIPEGSTLHVRRRLISITSFNWNFIFEDSILSSYTFSFVVMKSTYLLCIMKIWLYSILFLYEPHFPYFSAAKVCCKHCLGIINFIKFKCISLYNHK
jgi:hypothetical protein